MQSKRIKLFRLIIKFKYLDMSKRELWNEMADWLTEAFSFFERCLSNWKNFRVKVSGLVRLRPTVNLAFRDMYQIHWGLLTCLGMRDIYSGAYMSRYDT